MAADIKLDARGEPKLERILIVDQSPANTRLLADLLRNGNHCQVDWAQTDPRALAMCATLDPQIVFVELKSQDVDGLAFTRKLRRSDYAAREAPVIMVTGAATTASILAARDAGVHEFLRRPFNMADLKKRIDAVSLRKRDWVEAVSYVGPDRRRFNSAGYAGPRKRLADDRPPEMQRISQALKIVKSAVGAIESDPKQVFRALKAQAEILAAIGVANPALHGLARAAGGLRGYLDEALQAGRLSRDHLETHAAALLAAAPDGARPEARAKSEAA